MTFCRAQQDKASIWRWSSSTYSRAIKIAMIAALLLLELALAMVFIAVPSAGQLQNGPSLDATAHRLSDGTPFERQTISMASDLPLPTGGPSSTKEPREELPSAGLSTTVKPSIPDTALHPTTLEASQKPLRPHIIMIVIDDMGYADIGFKGSGFRTPTINGLVASGTHLTNYYVFPACTHTRIAFMTGKYPYRWGVYKVLEVPSRNGMNTNDATLANVLGARGYEAHAVGKWHLGHAWYDYLPTYRGFKSFLGCWLNKDHFNHTELVFNKAYDLHFDKGEKCGPDCSQTFDARGQYSTTVYTNRAVNVIRSRDASSDKPLFLYLAFQAVHTPLQVPPKYRAMYKSRSDWNEARKTCAGMLTAVDDGIAEVVKALKEKGMWKDTLMVITTDNGSSGAGQGGSNAPLRGYKMQTYEGAIRADGMIVGPARKTLGIRSGKNNRLFHALDWLPTLADLSDQPADDAAASKWAELDGVSQVRALRGGKANRQEAFLGYDYRDSTNTGLALRSGDLKLIRMMDGRYELYNLTSDIVESKNLRSLPKFKAIIKQMKRRIRSYEDGFNTTQPLLGNCPNTVAFGRTPWDQPLLIPWCNAELD